MYPFLGSVVVVISNGPLSCTCTRTGSWLPNSYCVVFLITITFLVWSWNHMRPVRPAMPNTAAPRTMKNTIEEVTLNKQYMPSILKSNALISNIKLIVRTTTISEQLRNGRVGIRVLSDHPVQLHLQLGDLVHLDTVHGLKDLGIVSKSPNMNEQLILSCFLQQPGRTRQEIIPDHLVIVANSIRIPVDLFQVEWHRIRQQIVSGQLSVRCPIFNSVQIKSLQVYWALMFSPRNRVNTICSQDLQDLFSNFNIVQVSVHLWILCFYQNACKSAIWISLSLVQLVKSEDHFDHLVESRDSKFEIKSADPPSSLVLLDSQFAQLSQRKVVCPPVSSFCSVVLSLALTIDQFCPVFDVREATEVGIVYNQWNIFFSKHHVKLNEVGSLVKGSLKCLHSIFGED